MARYIDPETGERIVTSRRPSFLIIVLFLVALGFAVWVMIPKNHAYFTFNSAPETGTVPIPKAPAGSVSGPGSIPAPDALPATGERTPTAPSNATTTSPPSAP